MARIAGTFRRGMTLVEIMIVLAVLLVVFGAVFLFFGRGSEEFDFSRRQNELATVGRLALQELTDIIIYAGFMPNQGWSSGNWQPIVAADSAGLVFYADYNGNRALDPSDYRNIEVVGESFLVSDSASYSRVIGSNIKEVDFIYLDESHNPMPRPLSDTDRGLVRHIRVDLILSDTYRNTEYTTEVTTTISPRNLGINHDINPAFSPPDPLSGNAVFNVSGAGAVPAPNAAEQAMINMLVHWGLTVVPLTDDQMASYDFPGNEISLIILRHRGPFAVFPHGNLFHNYSGPKDTLFIPVITLNARDAVDIFEMGASVIEVTEQFMDPLWAHPVNMNLPGGLAPFQVYANPFSTQSVIDNPLFTSPGDTVLTTAGIGSLYSGVSVRDENTKKRRIHFSAWDATEYTSPDGHKMFYNVVHWVVGESGTELGTLIEREDFEDPADYSWIDPGIGDDFYFYMESPWVSIPAPPPGYETVLVFDHCYWTSAPKNNGAYLAIDTTYSAPGVWEQIPNALLEDGYDDVSNPAYPGGNGIDIYSGVSDGFSYPASVVMTQEKADLAPFTERWARFRWIFGVNSKISNFHDAYIFDNPRVLFINTAAPFDTVALDPWTLHPDSMEIQLRSWDHDNFPGFSDGAYYHCCYAVDSAFPYEWGYSWTSWGKMGYIGEWTHGGTNDSWEIAASAAAAFTPHVDPAPTPLNGSYYAGTALTIGDGRYNPNEASWLMSRMYEVDSLSSYSKISLVIYRCIRNANDDAMIHVGFSADSTPPDPMNLTLWYPRDEPILYSWVNHTYWEEEVIDISAAVDSALADDPSYKHYWLLFTNLSGPSTEAGGWNLDNIEIYGDNP